MSVPFPNFRKQLHDFFHFVRSPRLVPRGKPRFSGSAQRADWCSGLAWLPLLKWALFLWLINLVFLGPIALGAATLGGAQHRLEIENLPWLQALIWAPIIEEMVFRYGMRRIVQALWLVPAAIAIMVSGPSLTAQLALVALLLASGLRWPYHCRYFWPVARYYVRYFPWVFHTASLAFAAVHLHNFNLNQAPLWLLPLLVLPQWLTGLVLGWQRVRYGIAASISLHALFNGGPLLLVWLFLQLLPDLS